MPKYSIIVECHFEYEIDSGDGDSAIEEAKDKAQEAIDNMNVEAVCIHVQDAWGVELADD